MLTKLLYAIVEMFAQVHSRILSLNDAYEYNFSDKELHFLVIGILGMALIFVIYPTFKLLASAGHVMVISWIYVFTLIIVVTFAIEIGQRVTGTGTMEFADIMFGVVGFLFMFFIFSVIRGIYHGIRELIRYFADRNKRPDDDGSRAGDDDGSLLKDKGESLSQRNGRSRLQKGGAGRSQDIGGNWSQEDSDI